MNIEQKAYTEILKLLKKHKDLLVFDVDDLERISKYHLFGIKLKEEYGLNVDPKNIKSLDWFKVGEYMSIGWWGEKYHRTVSWPDDGTRPEDELLLYIGFSRGAYIFGGDYPTEFFQKFFLELLSYNPKYRDIHNHSLYFSMDNAAEIFKDYHSYH